MSLTAMLEGPEELAGAVSKGRHKQILSSLPPALPAVLLGLLEKRCTKTPTASATANTQMARGTFSQDSWDDFDIGFDDTLGGSSRTLHQDLVDFEETSNRTEGDQRDGESGGGGR
ncbi:hypothetical protein E2C01_057279 [Portunus trituberculatus]|uniref:Uncharacterized protein n=1 Tax=Portunus trituberculatus TaxID=210409 RepID=A0A5B7H0M2_PORTR|nr:hypothetical protein [Portunus trituberculatus]